MCTHSCKILLYSFTEEDINTAIIIGLWCISKKQNPYCLMLFKSTLLLTGKKLWDVKSLRFISGRERVVCVLQGCVLKAVLCGDSHSQGFVFPLMKHPSPVNDHHALITSVHIRGWMRCESFYSVALSRWENCQRYVIKSNKRESASLQKLLHSKDRTRHAHALERHSSQAQAYVNICAYIFLFNLYVCLRISYVSVSRSGREKLRNRRICDFMPQFPELPVCSIH